MSVEFFITALIVVLIPGTGVIYTLSTGLLKGPSNAIAAAVGCTFGIVPHILASGFGLAALLHTSAVTFEFVKYAGVAYLLYLAYGLWKSEINYKLSSKKEEKSYAQIALHGLLINILNPKLSIFFLAFLPQFISVHAASPLLEMMFLGIVFMFITLIIFMLYGILAARLHKYIIDKPIPLKRIQRTFSLTFVGLGIKLALEER